MTDEVLAGRYRLDEPIATGGMGTVWRAHDEILQRFVAVKLLHDSLASDPAASERFRREALTAASITHPHMANVFDYVEEDGRPGIVMELVDGETLAQKLTREGRLPVYTAVRIATDVLTALQAAHEAGIIHRDVKPGNILLTTTGTVKVSDFGIARSLSDSSLTATGTVMGTAHYSAPEQVQGGFTTPATDLYSTGIVLYEMLTGTRPFQGDTPVAVAMARLTMDPEPPRVSRPAIPVALDATVMRALARDPEARFPSAAAMRDALVDTTGAIIATDDSTESIPVGAAEATVAFSPAQDTPPGPVGTTIPPRWARRRIAMAVTPLLLIGLAGLWLAASLRNPADTPAAQASTPPSPAQTAPAPVMVRVPDLIGFTKAEASAILQRRGLKLGKVTSRESGRPVNTIIDYDPAYFARVAKGTAINIVLAKAPPPPSDGDRDGDGDDEPKGKGKRDREFMRGGLANGLAD